MEPVSTTSRAGQRNGDREVVDVTEWTRFDIYKLTLASRKLDLLIDFSRYSANLGDEVYSAIRDLVEIYENGENKVVVQLKDSDSTKFSLLKAAHPSSIVATENVLKKYQTAKAAEGMQCVTSPVRSYCVKKPVKKRVRSSEDRVGALILCRCSSSRLPQKATLEINGRETIRLLIERIKLTSNVDDIILTTSTEPSDDALETIAKDAAVSCFRGPLEDVAQRMILAAREFQTGTIVRVTGDDILRDETMIDRIVAHHSTYQQDITRTDNMPEGTSSEVFDLPVLETIWEKAYDRNITGQLDWFFSNGYHFDLVNIRSRYDFDPRLRLTLDYEEDLRLLTAIFDHFRSRGVNFTLTETLEYLNANKELLEINSFRLPAMTQDEADCRLRI